VSKCAPVAIPVCSSPNLVTRYVAVGKMVDLLIEEWAHEHDIDL
jgi:hypothetical protein